MIRGSGKFVSVVLSQSQFDQMENFRRDQQVIPNRSEVLREALSMFLEMNGYAAEEEGD